MKKFLAFIFTFCASMLIIAIGFIAQVAYVYGPKEFFRLDNGDPTALLQGSTGVLIVSVCIYWIISMISLESDPDNK